MSTSNESFKSGVIVRRTAKKGLGVFANRFFKKGEVVVVGKLMAILRTRTDHSFQVGNKKHVDLDEPARLINHSCQPNTGVENNTFGGYTFIALTGIKQGDEITWDYETCEYISVAVPRCFCESKNCRGKTRGFRYLPASIKRRYGPHIADYLKG